MDGIHPVRLAEKHPWAAGAIVGGLLLLLLWLMGFFSRGSASSSDAGASQNLSAAYYAAEAAQLSAGTQLQIATVQADAATAQAGNADNAAVAINAANNATQQSLGTAYYTAQTTQNQSNNDAAVTLGAQGLTASLASTAAAAQTAQMATQYATLAAATHDQATTDQTFLNTVAPLEIAQIGGASFTAAVPGGSSFALGASSPNVAPVTVQNVYNVTATAASPAVAGAGPQYGYTPELAGNNG